MRKKQGKKLKTKGPKKYSPETKRVTEKILHIAHTIIYVLSLAAYSYYQLAEKPQPIHSKYNTNRYCCTYI